MEWKHNFEFVKWFWLVEINLNWMLIRSTELNDFKIDDEEWRKVGT